MTSMEELKTLSETFKMSVKAKPEAQLPVEKVHNLYEGYLKTPEAFFADPKTESYFLEEFSMEIIHSIATLTFIQDVSKVTELIRKIVELVLLEVSRNKYKLLLKIKPLLDPESAVYRYCLLDLKNTTHHYKLHINPAWRTEIKVGDKIDVLKKETAELEEVESWAIATVVRTDKDLLFCTFDGVNATTEETYNRTQDNISPLGSRTGDWSWRDKLSTGNLVDIFDTQGKWYLGTVLDVDTSNPKVRMLEVGFRVYIPDGTKFDSKGRRHEGWSSAYDTHLPAYSIRIQKAALDDENPAPNDSSDVLKYYPIKDDELCVVHRHSWSYSSFYLDLVNSFAKKGGFDSIILLAESTSNIECVLSCLELMAVPHQIYHRLYVIAKITPFVNTVTKYLTQVFREQICRVKKQSLEDALLHMEQLMQRIYTAKTKSENLIALRVKVSIALLGAEQLERRIQAIKLIADACKSAKASQEIYSNETLPKANDSSVLSSLLEVPQLIEEIFGKKSHIELIQRSTDILKFILSYSKITKEDFNVIWECCTRDEQSKVEIFKVISSSSNLLPVELIGFIIEKFTSIPKAAFKDQDIEVIYELSSGYAHLDGKTMKRILELMWQIIRGSYNNISIEMIEKIINRFCDTITTTSRVPSVIMEEFFERCYNMIKSGEHSIIGLEVLRKSMMQLPSIGMQKSRCEILFDILNSKGIFQSFFDDLERYYKNTKLKNEKKPINLQLHKEEISERKEFLLFMMRYAKYKLTKKELTLLWNNMVKNSITPEDQSIFYTFLKQLIIYKVEEYIASAEDLSDFFISTVCDESNDFQQLSTESVQVIERLLLIVNVTKGNIIEMKTVRKRRYDNYNNFTEEESNFCVKVLPTEIIGSSLLWKIVLEAKSEPVSMKAIELINMIHTKLSKELETQIGKISSNFIKVAIQKLNLCYRHMSVNKLNRSNEIVKILRLIEGMLDDSERKGNGNITPLGCLIKGKPLVLKIHNLATNAVVSPKVPKKFDLMVHSTITLWQLTTLIARKIKLLPEMIKLVSITKEVKDRDNGRPIEAFGFANENIIKVKKRNEEFTTRVSLIKNKKFTEKADKVFRDIFSQFSINGKMFRDNCVDFTRICLADENLKAEHHQIREIFKEYDRENKGYLTVDSFLHFYERSSINKEETVWKNLKELGYGSDLNTIDAAKEIINAKSIVRENLPRYLLSDSPEDLSFFFSLVDLGGEVGDAAWNLIFKLAPSERYLNKIKDFLAKEKVDWTEIFSQANYCESMYYLYLIQILIADGSDKELAEIRHEPTIEEKTEVRKNILKHKGIQWAMDYFKNFKELSDKPGRIAYPKMIHHLISVYLIGSMEANGKLSKTIKQYSVKKIKEDKKTNVKDSPLNSLNKSTKELFIKMEHVSPLDESYLEFYRDLCQLLIGELGLNLLSSVNLSDFALDITTTLSQLVSITRLSSDRQNFIEEIIIMLETLLICDPEIYNSLSKTHDFSQIYLKEVTNQNSDMKDQSESEYSIESKDNTQQLIYFLSANIFPKTCSFKEFPLIKMLGFFLDDKVLFNSSSASNSLYELLPLLIDQYANLNSDEVINVLDKFTHILNYLQTYLPMESSNPNSFDPFLLGLLGIAYKLLLINESGNNFNTKESIDLINKVFYGCLFPNEKGEYRCKSERTRKVAYDIIISLAKHDIECWKHLIKNCMLPIREKVSEPTSWQHSSNNYKRSNLGYTGIKNLGSICYINSMLQQFFMISPFRNAIITVCDGIPPSLTEEGIDDNLIHQFQRTFIYLSNSNRRDFVPSEFCYSFKEIDGRPTNVTIQHDAHEFLNILFERLERAFKDTPYKKLIQSIFGGKVCSQVICSNCGYISATYEDYYTLSLEIKNQRKLDDSLERFIAESTVSDYKCSNCEKRVDVGKRTLISSLPNVLIVHLQRFTYNFDTLMNEKISTRLEFPNSLDMTKYTKEGYQKHDEEKRQRKVSQLSHDNDMVQRKSSEIDEQEEKEKESRDNKFRHKEQQTLKEKDYYNYKLVGIVMHNGNAEAGHYYSYINTNRADDESINNKDKDRWLEFNDSIISSFSFDKIEECFGGTTEDISTGCIDDDTEVARLIGGRSKSAYMLIYERNKKGAIPLKVDPVTLPESAVVLDSLECDSTAVSRGEKNPRIYAKDSGDIYMLYNYYEVPFAISSYIADEVVKDNEVLLYEQLIYEKTFIDFLSNLFIAAQSACKLSSDPKSVDDLRSLLCVFVEKFFFEIESHAILSSVNFPIQIYRIVCGLFQSDPIQGRNLINKFVKEPKRLFKLAVECPEQQIRKIVCKSLLGAFNGLKPDDKVFNEFINTLAGLIGYELAVQWKKFKEFFELFKDIIESANDDLLKHCIEGDLIATLLDFFLEKSSPISLTKADRFEMGNYYQSPDFTTLMQTATYLLIHSDMPISSTEIVSPPTKQGKIKVVPPIFSMKCLNCNELLSKYLKSDSKIKVITNLLIHVSYKNRKQSQRICRQLLRGINNYETTRILQYLDVFTQTLTLEDEYSPLRMESLLGYAQPLNRISYGLAEINDIEDDVNFYTSSSETTLLENEEKNKPLLQMLWDERRRSENLITQFLKMLFTLTETNVQLYTYLRDTPPPCYLYCRYIDWIEEFLETYYRGVSCMTDEQVREKDNLVIYVKELYKKFRDRVEKDGVKPPQFYMVGKIVSSRELKDKEIVIENVKLTVSEITVEVYESKPRGKYNAGLSGNYLIKYFSHMRNNANSRFESQERLEYEEYDKLYYFQEDIQKKSINDLMFKIKAIDKASNKGEDKIVDETQINREITKVESNTKEPKIIITMPCNNPNTNDNLYDSSIDTEYAMEMKPKYKTLAIFHKINVINNSYDKINIILSITPNDSESALNFYCPVSKFKCRATKFIYTIFTAQLNDLDKPMGDYTIHFKVKNLSAPKLRLNLCKQLNSTQSETDSSQKAPGAFNPGIYL